MDLFNERRVTWLDGCYLGALAFTCAILTLNIFLNSLLLIYAAILLVLAFLVYASVRQGAPPLLRGVWLMGLLPLRVVLLNLRPAETPITPKSPTRKVR